MKDLKSSAEPKLSSTLILLKGNESPEILMVLRHSDIEFAPGAMVFPGGKLTEDDRHEDWRLHCHGEFSGNEMAVRIGGIREAFEESGLLLATLADAAPDEYVGQDICDQLAPFRSGVDRGKISFLGLIRDHGLRLNLNALQPFAHWITPEFLPKRFDTRFYVARTPKGQHAVHDGRETTEAVWSCAEDVLARYAAGEVKLLFPTRVNLEMLEDLGATHSILKFAKAENVVEVLPVLQKKDTGNVLVIPVEAGYRVTEEPLERVMKTVG
ncbi:NUDIX hydrolase [Ponticaulis sp.]|uniref:NUDIX hydrolase n=1 Tax=Ponticaulis sp. TaxID=2020902 RepID=UPI000B6D8386|nr:NUDIX hydrolase [Ponticaulis sp.]MAI91933.1 NUDIX hydrolase [Ponticaulis sp.]OUX96408.1 MAG: hypothetical protein CBB65_16000 [Hyphomonadaceae bacterium TMED5]